MTPQYVRPGSVVPFDRSGNSQTATDRQIGLGDIAGRIAERVEGYNAQVESILDRVRGPIPCEGKLPTPTQNSGIAQALELSEQRLGLLGKLLDELKALL